MRRWLLLVLTAGLIVSNTGCLINVYSPDPNQRIKELLNQSEDYRSMQETWERIWFTDHPSHLTPNRVDGAIQ